MVLRYITEYIPSVLLVKFPQDKYEIIPYWHHNLYDIYYVVELDRKGKMV